MDLYNNIKLSRGISPAAATTDNTAWVSQIIDTANFAHTVFAFCTGSLADADATFTVLFEDGDNASLTDNAAVADAYLLGTEALAGFQYDDDNETRKIGYIGSKRYCRVTITPANNTGNAFVSGMWIQSGARVDPQS